MPSQHRFFLIATALGFAGLCLLALRPTRTAQVDAHLTATMEAGGQLFASSTQSPPIARNFAELFPHQKSGIQDWRQFAPNALTVRLTEGLEVPFRVSGVEISEKRTVLTARIDGAATEHPGLEGAFLVGTSNAQDRWDAVVVLPGMEYRIRVRAGDVTVEEAPNQEFPCDTAGGSDPEADGVMPLTAGDTLPAGTAFAEVLFLYNPEALSEKKGDTLAIDADCSNYIAACNVVLQNSRITQFAWRFLAAIPAPSYSTTNKIVDDFNAMVKEGPLVPFVATARSTYGADQVVLLAGGLKVDWAGYASIGGTVRQSVVNYPFPTFTNGTRSTSATSYLLVCHELGHNFGCRHDRDNPDSLAADADGLHSFGFRFTDPLSTRQPAEIAGTVMVNGASYRIPYFSHPEIEYSGVKIGVPLGQPRSAFNAKMLMDYANYMVTSQASVTKPAIAIHPASQQVNQGQTVTLAVSATGNSLTYSWRKDGTPVPNATTSTLALASVSNSETGSYTVTVTNYLGSVTSNAAIVSLAPAPTPTPTPVPAAPSGGGGGGGGGAVSPLFLLVLALLTGVRRFTRSPRR